MIRVLLFIALLAALAFGGVWLLDMPGGVVMTVQGYRIETSLIAAAGVVLALTVALLFVWSVLRYVLRLPATIGLATRARRRAKGFAAVSRGMVAVGAGDPRAARRYAADAGKLLGDEPLALLLRAQAAQMAGDRGSAEGAFRRMLDEPETRVLGLRGLFVEARRKGDGAAARAYAAEAARIAPTVSWAGEALLEYQCADHDWTGALGTLERGAKGLDKATVRRHRAVLLTADAMARADREPEAALSRAQEALKLAPTLVPAATLAARLLARRGDLRKASRTVETIWSHEPHPDLAAAYVNVRAGDSAKDRLKRAERLLSLRPRDAESRIAVATEAVAAREPARAREVLRPLVEAEERPSVRVCLLMADVEDMEHGADGAVREWFARASRAPRDPAWIADGVIASTWAPVSPVTGRLDAFVWGTPVEQLADYDPERPAPGDRARFHLAAPDAVMADVDEPVALSPSRVHEAAPAEPPAVQPAPVPEPPPVVEPVAPPAREPATAAAETPPAPAQEPVPLPVSEPVPEPARLASPAPEPEPTAPPAPPKAEREPAAETRPAPPHGERDLAAEARPVATDTPRRPADRGAGRRSPGPLPVVFPVPTPPDDPGPERGDSGERARIGFLQ
ncbi:heme biosynthesis protein HemY [Alsobacter sp. SYSU M60028]|uniref:Heme biosynthesis protein HemY n=1 Tax=Alsobacter ponti TaxID=2962936 RepID=A0ABT1LB87_9HYPH|nr:heme biosynthesis HemY N-terminal domain-containing protein [Alsobacter ponti]MCP8938742.1 heme biosynthesis protein HemY [Alsobacter ponti]